MAPDFEQDDITLLPLIPEAVLKKYKVHEPHDTRFRAAARLLQAIWRVDRDLPIGSYTTASGRTRKLGSRIADSVARDGANFLTPAIAQLARREASYRETGAMIDEDRLRGNLLSSMPLTFNLLGILRLDLALGTRVMQALLPDLGIDQVRGIWFEHSPGRADAALTDDHTAFDAIVIFTTAGGGTGFGGIEAKYAESRWEPVPDFKPRYDTLLGECGLFRDSADPALRKAPIQQLTREHCLAQATLMRGDYDVGAFVLIAPALNGHVQVAARKYAAQLAEVPAGGAPFINLTLDRVIEAIEAAGETDYGAALRRRYIDWWSVDGAIELAMDPPATPPLALLPAPAAAPDTDDAGDAGQRKAA